MELFVSKSMCHSCTFIGLGCTQAGSHMSHLYLADSHQHSVRSYLLLAPSLYNLCSCSPCSVLRVPVSHLHSDRPHLCSDGSPACHSYSVIFHPQPGINQISPAHLYHTCTDHGLTCTLDSGRLILSATSSLMKMSG